MSSCQVRALQILETVQLMASGYPHRMRFRAFSCRYRALWGRGHAGVERESGASCARVLAAVAAAAAPPAPASPAAVRWALGKRHVFLSEAMRQVPIIRSHLTIRLNFIFRQSSSGFTRCFLLP